MTKEEFARMAAEEVILLDGATGSNLRRAGMPVGVCAEQWVLDHPEPLLTLQREYAQAGSRIVYAPTFSANRVGLGHFGLEDRLAEMNKALMALSRRAVEGKALVAGDLTTTGVAIAPAGDMELDELYRIYQEQAAVLAEAGADLLVAETMLSVQETAAALDAIQSVCDLPVMCTLTLQADGAAIYGGSAAEAVVTLQELGAAAVGLNCSVGPDQLTAVVASMRAVATVPIIAKPNAGMPTINDRGEAEYSMGKGDFARHLMRLVEAGASIVGGCCGTTPEYIREAARLLKAENARPMAYPG